MKHFFIIVLCFISILTLAGCNSYNLRSGYYFLVGDYEEGVTPYVNIDYKDNSFTFGEGLILSYAEHGSFTVQDERMTATTQNTTFVFEIKNSSLIILIDCGEYEPLISYEGSEFTYCFST